MLHTRKTNKTIFLPPQLIFKKKHKSVIKNQIYNAKDTLLFSTTFGIKANECAKVTHKQNENLRRNLVRTFKKNIISFRHSLIPNRAITQKSSGTRMGKGKGAVRYWINRLSSGKIGMHFCLQACLDKLIYYKAMFKSMGKSLNYKYKLIINKHFLQEVYQAIEQKKNF